MKSSLFVTEIQLLSFSPLVVIITNHWIYAWNRFSIANKMMINWVPGLLSWIVFFVLSSSHGKSVHTLECIRKGCKSWFRLIIDEVKALCALFWFWQHWLCQILLMVMLIIARLLELPLPPNNPNPDNRSLSWSWESGAGGATWLGEERDTAPIVRVFCFFGRAKEWGWTVWRDTIGDWDLHRKIMMKCKCCFSSFCHIIVQLVMILLINLPLVAPTCREQTFQFVPVPQISGWFAIISICSTPH